MTKVCAMKIHRRPKERLSGRVSKDALPPLHDLSRRLTSLFTVKR